MNLSKTGILYLIPNTLGDSAIDKVIPSYNQEIINSIDEYIVENEKSARYFLKKSGIKISLHNIKLYPLNEHIPLEEISNYLSPKQRVMRMLLRSFVKDFD